MVSEAPGPYEVAIRASALKEVEALPIKLRARISGAIESLSRDPRPISSMKLSGSDNEYRIRVGDYRIVCVVNHPARRIEISRVRHRKDVYRGR